MAKNKDRDTPHVTIPQSIFRTIKQHARTSDQIEFIAGLWFHLSHLLNSPSKDKTDTNHRIGLAINLLRKVIHAMGCLGPMTEEYVRSLFHYGEQALRILEAALGQQYGGREVVWEHLVIREGRNGDGGEEGLQRMHLNLPPDTTLSKSLKAKRPQRRAHIHAHLSAIFARPTDDLERLDMALTALTLCAGKELTVVKEESGNQVKLPEIERGDERWEAEMWCYAMMAVMGMAQCLGQRFMRWPVEVRGQVVPGTGVVVGEALGDWRAIEDA
ncbi:hypothetical protein LTR85_007400 [Meristemomyces frigidus]|nr:hypothetical protein LTR85_007400 [Meristemomyces frigidus]